MITWDTNFLVRHVLADDPVQFRVVQRVLAEADARGVAVFLPLIAIAETFWVLRSAYGLAAKPAASILSDVLRDERFVFEAREAVEQSVRRVLDHGGDLGDMLIGEASIARNALPVHTFDTGLRRCEEFKVHRAKA